MTKIVKDFHIRLTDEDLEKICSGEGVKIKICKTINVIIEMEEKLEA